MEVNISSATRIRCQGIFQSNRISRTGSSRTGSATNRQSRTESRNNSRHGSRNGSPTNKSGKRPRTISKGVVNLLSTKKDFMMRNDALDILRENHNQGMMRTKSKKKLTGIGENVEEPFNGDIVMAMSQLLPPLEQCAVELTNLLKDSLGRFKKTRSCGKLYQEYIEKKQTQRLANR